MSLIKDAWMQEFFMQSMRYKSQSEEQLVIVYFKEFYREKKQNVDNLLAIYTMIYSVSDEENKKLRR